MDANVVSFSISAFLASLPADQAPTSVPVGRLTKSFLEAAGLTQAFNEWKREQHRRRKAAQPRTDQDRERDRVNQAVSRSLRRTGGPETRATALVHVRPRFTQAAGRTPRTPRWFDHHLNAEIRSQLLAKLEATTFERHEHQRKAIAQGQSMVFGTVFSRRLQSYNESHTARNNPRLYSLLKQLAATEVPEFSFTTIAVNKNVVTQPHVDKYNVGPTLILGLGSFTGGALVVKDTTYALQEQRWLYFWGKDEHYNTPLKRGTKYTVTLFTLLPPYAPPDASTHNTLGRINS